ncbi:ABC transporter ATP-binding protein [Halalkalibacillus sediminis]|uniref:ABC transporter ATP-binding protein n=1 Tax=Halalkalibacillus sediminis TaxID=2018042 RepID=A0A2I0QVR1_9BACI|nr:ABC transporter ATP-binding protein [Halalkalibacillus sediminis]PKR78404.1 ABC transporter ATP-binding protein [Halalkalibacillus sediminis]
MLKLKNISVAFKDNKVLDQLDFSATEGEVIGIAAPNGTGKTTMFNVISNYLKPDEGKVVFQGQYEYKSEKDQVKIYQGLTNLPNQDDLFEDLSGVDHIKLFANMWNGKKKGIQSIIDELNMDHYVRNKVKTYSLGMRQRLCFAMMRAADSSVMLMDEVMNGLDISNVSLISDKLIEMKHEGKLMFVASHLLENLDIYADRVLFLRGGKIVHEHDVNNNDETFIKLELNPTEYENFIQKHDVPENHHYISKRLLCIPFSTLPSPDQMEWIEIALEYNHDELDISTLGTLEFYEKYYHDISYIRN